MKNHYKKISSVSVLLLVGNLSFSQLQVVSSGNVGIGTTTPATRLHVYTTSSENTDVNFNLETAGTGKAAFMNLLSTSTVWGGVQQSGAGAVQWFIGNRGGAAGDLNFYTTSSYTNRLTIQSAGNVGVRTSSPDSYFSVNGGKTNATGITVKSDDVDLILTEDNSTNAGKIQVMSGSYGAVGTTAYTLALQPEGGKVGIGTTSPARLFEVNGQMRTTNDNPEKLNSGSWTGYSDQRLKQNILPFKDGLTVLRQVNPVTFQFNGIGNLSTNETHIGVIAQTILPIAPYCVKVGEGKLKVKQSEAQNFSGAEILETLPPDNLGETYTMVSPLMYNYDGLIYVMINSIKQLDSTNTQLLKKDSILKKNDSVKDAAMNVLQNKIDAHDSLITYMQSQMNDLIEVINTCCQNKQQMIKQPATGNSQDDSKIQTNKKDIELSNKNIQIVVLDQNVPNPFADQTVINYSLPDNFTRAQIIFLDQSGKLIKAIDLTEKGKGQLNVFANDLTSGVYTYSLIIDGQTVETKKMVKSK